MYVLGSTVEIMINNKKNRGYKLASHDGTRIIGLLEVKRAALLWPVIY